MPPSAEILSKKKNPFQIAFMISLIVLPILGLIWWNIDVFGGPPRADPNSVDCMRASATITEKHNAGRSTRNTNEKFYMTFSYSVNGKSYTTEQEVDNASFLSHQPNDSCSICYMKDFPERAVILGNGITAENTISAIIVDAIVTLLGIVLFIAWRKKKRTLQTKN